MRWGFDAMALVSVCLVVHVTACELRAFAKKCVDIPEGIGRSDRARHASRIVVADRVTFASVHAPAGLGEVAHGGVEERFGGLVHGRARREGSRSLE